MTIEPRHVLYSLRLSAHTYLTMLVLLASRCSAAEPRPNEPPDGAAIRRTVQSAWDRRQSQITSFFIELQVTDYAPEGYLATVGEQDERAPGRTLTTTESIWISGDKAKYLKVGQVYSTRAHDVVQITSEAAYDGKVRKIFRLLASSPEPKQGTIDTVGDVSTSTLRHVAPVYWYIQPSTKVAEILKRSELIEVKSGSQQELVFKDSEDEIEMTVTSAPSYNIKRFQRQLSDTSSYIIEVTYVEGSGFGGAVPASWTFTTTRGDESRAISAQVKAIQINEPIPDNEFSITFPKGTAVIDFSSGRAQRFTVDTDGELTPAIAVKSRDGVSKTLIAVNVTAILSLIAIMLWKRNRARTQMGR